MNLPNFITILRLLAVPVIVWLLLSGFGEAAFWLFVAAGASDALDGLIAKRYGLVTDTGRYLDPIADKTLLVAVYVTLGYLAQLPSWLVILVVSRDILIVGGALLANTLEIGMQIRPLMVSKINTGTQIVLAALVLGQPAFAFLEALTAPVVVPVLTYAVGVTTVASGLSYLVRWGRTVERPGGP